MRSDNFEEYILFLGIDFASHKIEENAEAPEGHQTGGGFIYYQ